MSWHGMKKQNLTQQKHAFTNQNKYKINKKNKSQVYSPLMTDSLEMETAYSYFGVSQICHLLTYLDTNPLTYSPVPTQGTKHGEVIIEYKTC